MAVSRNMIMSFACGGFGGGFAVIALSELIDLRMTKARFAIFAAMIFSTLLFNISHIWSTSEFIVGNSISLWAFSFNLWTFSHMFADALITYHYFERLLIIMNRTDLRKFLFLPVAIVLPKKFLLVIAGIIGAAGGPLALLGFLGQVYEVATGLDFLDGFMRLFTIMIDVYIIHRLRQMGLNQSGYSLTRISRLVTSVVLNIAFIAWIGAVFVPDEASARVGLKALLMGLDLLIIMDFFAIDLNGVLKTTQSSTKRGQNQLSGQTGQLSKSSKTQSTA
ncbi:hypothetical protein BKA69DRAFT_1042256 [Paraphysoderma sedebokerense]|nr:hypothetical protein BKA69DRAFT_1042256 [Paraphysoderma sedebokerense]